MRRFSDRALEAFTSWFCSGGGVWQTAIVVVAVVVVELVDRRLDPHAFLLMAVLTVYSAVTQPALAYSGQQGAQKMEALEERVADLEASNGRLLAAIAEKVGVEVEP